MLRSVRARACLFIECSKIWRPVRCAENEKGAQAAANPVKEPCDIGVKIADFGNACWTVSCSRRSLLSINKYRFH